MTSAACAALLGGAASADAARHKLRLRHHGDPMRVLKHSWGSRPIARAAANTLTDLPTTWCGTGAEPTADVGSPLSNAPQIKVIYAYASDGSDNFNQNLHYENLIQSDVNAIRERVADDSGNAKSVRFDLGNGAVGCPQPAAKYADIQVVHLPKTKATYNGLGSALISTLRTDILTAIGAGAPASRTDYVVYADQINPGGGVAGEAQTPQDDSHGYGNAVNHGPNGDGRVLAVIYGFGGADFNGGAGASVRKASFLHEMSHTQGAVQNSALHSTGANHCWDEQDIMCYDDGGPNAGMLRTDCNLGAGAGNEFAEALDCNNDDYFAPSPAAGSYLATHWNEFDSVYFCAVASCDSVLGAPAVALGGPDNAVRGSTLSLTANATGATIERYEWDLDNDGVFERDTGTTNSTSQQLTANGAKIVRVRASTPDGTFATDTKTITVSEPTTPTPAFTITSGAPEVNKPVTFDASGTTDPSGVITSYQWDFDGNTTIDLNAGLTKTATTTYTTAGPRFVTLVVNYPLGLSTSTAQVTVGAGGGVVLVPGPKLVATLSKLAKLLTRGLALKVTCGGVCTVTAKLTVSAATAKKLKLKGKRGKPVTIGSLKRTLPGAGILKTQILLTSAARRALAKVRSVVMALTAMVTQPGATPLNVKRTLTIKR